MKTTPDWHRLPPLCDEPQPRWRLQVQWDYWPPSSSEDPHADARRFRKQLEPLYDRVLLPFSKRDGITTSRDWIAILYGPQWTVAAVSGIYDELVDVLLDVVDSEWDATVVVESAQLFRCEALKNIRAGERLLDRPWWVAPR